MPKERLSPYHPDRKEAKPKSHVALIFPGQGSQFVGMGKDLHDRYKSVKTIYQIADQVSGIPISRISFEGPEEKLNKTTNTQLAVLTHNEACRQIAIEQKHEGLLNPQYLAGHSLGYYNALIAGGAITFEQGVGIVKKRGDAVQLAGELKPGKQIAIFGLTEKEKRRLELKRIMQELGIEPSAENADNQLIIGVPNDSLEEFRKWQEANSIKTIILKTAGMFHTSAMKPALAIFFPEVDKLDIKDSRFDIVANSTGQFIRRNVDLKKEAKTQLIHPVRWNYSYKEMKKHGATFIEIGNTKGILINMDNEARQSPGQVKIIYLTPNGKRSGLVKFRSLQPQF